MSEEIEEIYSQLEQKVKPLLNKLVNSIIVDKPENVALYMINFLQREGGVTSTGLTYDEKIELNNLRREVNEFRQREEKEKEEENSESVSKSVSSDEDDEFENEEEELKFKKRLEQKMNDKRCVLLFQLKYMEISTKKKISNQDLLKKPQNKY